MQLIPLGSEDFCTTYIHNNLGKKLKDYSALYEFVIKMDADVFKRMCTAYRADKKRKADKEANASKARIDIDNNAHIKLKDYANSLNVTLSQALITAIDAAKDNKLLAEVWIDTADERRIQANMLYEDKVALETENKQLKADIESIKSQLTENDKRDTVTDTKLALKDKELEQYKASALKRRENYNLLTIELAESKREIKMLKEQISANKKADVRLVGKHGYDYDTETENDKRDTVTETIITEKRCCAITASGKRCKNTENLNIVGSDGMVLCKFHYTMNTHSTKGDGVMMINHKRA